MPITNVTAEEFVAFFDDTEANELSHLNLPNDPVIYLPKIQLHLDSADNEFWSSLTCIDSLTPPASVLAASKIWIMRIARYTLDYNNPRDSVVADYDRFLQYVERTCPVENSDDGGSIIDDSLAIMSAFSI